MGMIFLSEHDFFDFQDSLIHIGVNEIKKSYNPINHGSDRLRDFCLNHDFLDYLDCMIFFCQNHDFLD